MIYLILIHLMFFVKISYQIMIIDTNCERIDYTAYKYRGSTTDYDEVRGYENLTNNDCRPIQIWSLFRHGIRTNNLYSHTRNDGLLENIKNEIIRTHVNGMSLICDDEVESLKYWQFDELLLFEEKFLTQSGRNQMLTIGKRMHNHFLSLFKQHYDPEWYYLASSSYQRTIASMRAFAEGFFQGDTGINTYYFNEASPVAEYSCSSAMAAQYEKDYDLYPPLGEFVESSNMYKKVRQSLSDRTGLPEEIFQKDAILALYEACTYETARDTKLSPWCFVFRLEDLALLRNREEMLHYMISSYGSEYWDQFGCVQAKDMIATFNDTVHKKDGYKMKSFFTHDGTLENMLVNMGCFRDPHIESNYNKFDENHVWNISFMIPFGANILAVLYSCEDNDDDYEIQFYLNETPMGCCITNSTDACSWNEFRSRMQDFVTNCKENYCEDDAKSAGRQSSLTNRVLAFCILCLILLNNLKRVDAL